MFNPVPKKRFYGSIRTTPPVNDAVRAQQRNDASTPTRGALPRSAAGRGERTVQ